MTRGQFCPHVPSIVLLSPASWGQDWGCLQVAKVQTASTQQRDQSNLKENKLVYAA